MAGTLSAPTGGGRRRHPAAAEFACPRDRRRTRYGGSRGRDAACQRSHPGDRSVRRGSRTGQSRRRGHRGGRMRSGRSRSKTSTSRLERFGSLSGALDVDHDACRGAFNQYPHSDPGWMRDGTGRPVQARVVVAQRPGRSSLASMPSRSVHSLSAHQDRCGVSGLKRAVNIPPVKARPRRIASCSTVDSLTLNHLANLNSNMARGCDARIVVGLSGRCG